jgi:transposase-like protein
MDTLGQVRHNQIQTMPKRTKNYTQEFRAGAVDLLRTSDQPLSQVARELGVSVAKELWDENQKLKRENAYLRRQRVILKKAASILGEDLQLGMR